MRNEKQQVDNQIEDLTVSETETENVKGGMFAADYLLQLDGVKGESSDDRHSR
jgi:hypothetical protein